MAEARVEKYGGELTEAQQLRCIAWLMERENELLINRLNCVQCKIRSRGVTFVPCGHYSLCAICSKDIYICPLCKKTAYAEIKSII